MNPLSLPIAAPASTPSVSTPPGSTAESAGGSVEPKPFGSVFAGELQRQSGAEGGSPEPVTSGQTSRPDGEALLPSDTPAAHSALPDAAPWLFAPFLAQRELNDGQITSPPPVESESGIRLTAIFPAESRSDMPSSSTSTAPTSTRSVLPEAPIGRTLDSPPGAESLANSSKAVPVETGSQPAAFSTLMTETRLQGALASQASNASPVQPSYPLPQPTGSAAWNQALGERIVWMAGQNQQAATLTLNPPELGPVQVTLKIVGELTTAHFAATHPEARQSLEAALPRLRDMMQEAGIQLGQASVGSDAPNPQPERMASDTIVKHSPSPTVEPSPVGSLPLRRGIGLVDTFA